MPLAPIPPTDTRSLFRPVASELVTLLRSLAPADWERPTDTLTLDIYPSGKSAYEMYEDDGLTREHRNGAFATTRFEVNAKESGNFPIEIILSSANGDFNGRLNVGRQRPVCFPEARGEDQAHGSPCSATPRRPGTPEHPRRPGQRPDQRG